MESFLGFTITVTVYILFAYLFYKTWELILEEVSETLNNYMVVISIILGILFPITSLIILPVTAIVIYKLFNDSTK